MLYQIWCISVILKHSTPILIYFERITMLLNKIENTGSIAYVDFIIGQMSLVEYLHFYLQYLISLPDPLTQHGFANPLSEEIKHSI